MRPPHKRVILTILGLLGALALAAAVLLSLPESVGKALLSEGGVIETASALGYVGVAGMLVWAMARDDTRQTWPLVVILLAMFGRELDLDKRPFTLGLFKSRQYLGDQVPGVEKLISLVILLVILTCLFLAARRYGGEFLRGLRDGVAQSWYLATGLVLVVISKSVDGIGRKLAPFGIDISDVLDRRFAALEELWELGIPITFALAVLAAASRKPNTVAP
ncbi:hypothetical protein [Palleronia caenipelagi]|uniref:Uncharacterized protein n=1 Tax=Palleronia caenipelagi TaxID=2489174 RepID=A0A547QB11_9RHOB|nr:hypothetical protein [Palleronia caenipelagi]TRD23562.1 hypothetical protein FEV53_00665 [Palleronia caenipelagi]